MAPEQTSTPRLSALDSGHNPVEVEHPLTGRRTDEAFSVLGARRVRVRGAGGAGRGGQSRPGPICAIATPTPIPTSWSASQNRLRRSICSVTATAPCSSPYQAQMTRSSTEPAAAWTIHRSNRNSVLQAVSSWSTTRHVASKRATSRFSSNLESRPNSGPRSHSTLLRMGCRPPSRYPTSPQGCIRSRCGLRSIPNRASPSSYSPSNGPEQVALVPAASGSHSSSPGVHHPHRACLVTGQRQLARASKATSSRPGVIRALLSIGPTSTQRGNRRFTCRSWCQ